MFGSSQKSREDRTLAHTLISRKTELVGDLHFSGELIIEGKIKGNIYAADEAEALVRIAESGVVEGEICVPTVVVNGLVNGDIHSTKHVELAAKAVVVGNVYYSLIEMVMGSEINGSLMHLVRHPREAHRLGTGDAEGNRVISQRLTGQTSEALPQSTETAQVAEEMEAMALAPHE
jgi:cytoskeletal protein CcmA (bactofilin family)